MDIADPHDATAQAVRDLIDQEGGPLVPEALGDTLRNAGFLHTLASLHFLEETLNRTSVRNGGRAVSVHLTRSPSMGASVRSITGEHAAVLVPVGTLARLQVLHRLLLGYWSYDRAVPGLIASLFDRPFDRRLPLALVPLLQDLHGATDWWGELDALNASIELDPRFDPDVGELNHLALSLLLAHEFAHVWRRHVDVRRRVRAGELSFGVGDDPRRAAIDGGLGRAMENDADRIAAYVAVWTLLRQTEEHPDWRPRAFVRLGYAVTALLALFDPNKLSVMHFGDDSTYPHPTIRHTAYLEHIAACATGLGVPDDIVDANLNFGARKALDALSQLEYDIYSQRRFCADDEKAEPIIHALRGSRANMLSLARDAAAEEALSRRLHTLITDTYGEFVLT